MNIQDIKSWTYGFMKRNESQCVEYIVSLRDDALFAVQDGDFQKASQLYRAIVCGMEKLSEIDQDTYEPPLYAAAFCVARVEAFYIKNRAEAVEFLKIARNYAKKCSGFGRTNPVLAERDLEVIDNLLSKLATETEFSKLVAEFGEEEWNLANEAAFSSFQPDNTISGIGCLAFIAVAIVLVVLYTYVSSINPNVP